MLYINHDEHTAIFEANDLKAGVYYYTIMIDGKAESGKMILAK